MASLPHPAHPATPPSWATGSLQAATLLQNSFAAMLLPPGACLCRMMTATSAMLPKLQQCFIALRLVLECLILRIYQLALWTCLEQCITVCVCVCVRVCVCVGGGSEAFDDGNLVFLSSMLILSTIVVGVLLFVDGHVWLGCCNGLHK